jgi:hypothetical protein
MHLALPIGPQPKRFWTGRVSSNLNLPWALKKKVCRIKNKQMCFDTTIFRASCWGLDEQGGLIANLLNALN